MHRSPTATAACRARTATSTAATTASGTARTAPASNRIFSGSLSLVDPRLLNGLENPLAAALRIVAEAGQRQHPLVEIDEVHRRRVLLRVRLAQRDGDVQGVGPLHAPALTSFLRPRARS